MTELTPLHQTQAISYRNFMTNTYLNMAGGLAVTAAASWAMITSGLVNLLLGNVMVLYILMGVELLFVFVLGGQIARMPVALALFMFIIYAGLNGVTLSPLFAAYQLGSVGTVFAITGGTFAATATWAHFTRVDLTQWGSFLMMGLIGLIIAMLVNMWLNNPMMSWITSVLAVVLFTALTAYDVKKLKQLYENDMFAQKTEALAIYGALQLYLDFVNLFIHLLRLLGRRN
jgi:uncharacterized protein